ncbi:MAG TPA: glycosyltransferase family 2 protein [Gemmatimonadales bacterium]|nr:glycosyltransferase family 2 protein [Gemmatimonadales bacterium]
MIWVPLAYLAFFVVLMYRFGHRRPQLRDYPPAERGPFVSVIIPARDEAVNIVECVTSVLNTPYPLEVIVVDDRSSDDTAALVQGLREDPTVARRLRLVRGAELPSGWFGKPWALVQGYREARGELILFADADTRHTPELVGRAVRVLEEERVELVSLLARQAMVTFWERLVQPHVFIALASRVGNLERINRTRVPWDAIAAGQFILTTRAAYEQVGTHEAVKNSVAEDAALAQAYARAGLDIFLLHAVEYVTTRMYRTLGEIVEGWSKNLALGVPLLMPPIPLLRRAAPYIMWLPSLAWILPPVFWLVGGSSWAALTVLISLAIWAAAYRAEEAPPVYALLYPFGAGVLAGIMLRSAWRGGRKVEWRGRTYSAPPG